MDVELVKAEDIKEKEKIKEKENPYVITALDGIYAGARQYLLDMCDQEYHERIRKTDIDDAIVGLERAFLEWEKTGRPDIRTWDSAIYLVDIVIAAGILHEKLEEKDVVNPNVEEITTTYATELEALEEVEE